MMRLIIEEKYFLRFVFFDMISQNLNLNVRFLIMLFIWTFEILLLCTKPPSPVQTERGNFLNFSSGLEETLMMRLITKEKYVLRFDFLIWSLKIWIWMYVFWLCYFFGHSKFLQLCTKPPSPVQTAQGKFPEFFLWVRGDPNDQMMRLITKEKYVLRFDFLIWSLKVWIWTYLLPIIW